MVPLRVPIALHLAHQADFWRVGQKCGWSDVIAPKRPDRPRSWAEIHPVVVGNTGLQSKLWNQNTVVWRSAVSRKQKS